MNRLCGLLTLVVLLGGAAGSGEAQVLPLVADNTSDVSQFWWSTSRPRPTSFDRALLEALGERGLDPEAVADGPAISQVYRAADLGDASARNLGGLFGATSVLVGSLSRRSLGTVTGDLFWIAEIEVAVRWLDVDAEIERAAFALSAVGQGTDPEAALGAARAQLASALADELARRRSAAPGLGVYASDSPLLVVRHLTAATPLVALLGELRARDAVVTDLAEVWASEGALAYAVELAPGAPLSAWSAVVDELARSETWGYQLVVLSRDGLQTEVRVDERAPLEPPTSGEAPR